MATFLAMVSQLPPPADRQRSASQRLTLLPDELIRMLHFHYVGHFDPLEPIDRSRTDDSLPRLKVLRILPKSAVDKLMREFADVAQYIEYNEFGYVVCHWSSAPQHRSKRIHEFALKLATLEDALLMNEAPAFMIEYPETARASQQAMWMKCQTN